MSNEHIAYCTTMNRVQNISMVSCQKGPICHAYAWQIGPFWQDTLDITDITKDFQLIFHLSNRFAIQLIVLCTVIFHRCSLDSFRIDHTLGVYSLRRRSLISIGIPIINLRRSSNRLRFIMVIPIPVRRYLLSEWRPWRCKSIMMMIWHGNIFHVTGPLWGNPSI